MNMPLDAFLTAVYTIVDDWYQVEGRALLAHKPGKPPEFSASEVITLTSPSTGAARPGRPSAREPEACAEIAGVLRQRPRTYVLCPS